MKIYYGWDYLRKTLARILTCRWFKYKEISRKIFHVERNESFGKRTAHMKRICDFMRTKKITDEKFLYDL